MVAKFLDDNKPIKSLTCKSLFALFQTSPILFNLIHFIWQILAKFSLGPYLSLSKLRKKSDNFCVLFTYSITRAREIRTFHIAVVQRRQRNVQNSVIHGQICCFVNKNLLLFCRSLSVAVVVGQVCCHTEIVLPW